MFFVEKMGACIRVLQRSLETEENHLFQSIAAEFLALLMLKRVGEKPCPNSSILKAICILAVENLSQRAQPDALPLETISYRGGLLFMKQVVREFDKSLFDDLPFLLKLASLNILEVYGEDGTLDRNDVQLQVKFQEEIFLQLQILSILLRNISSDPVKKQLEFMRKSIIGALRHPNEKLRFQACRVVVDFVRQMPTESLNFFMITLFPML